MRQTIFALVVMLAAVATWSAAAQDITVRVKAGDEPVGYAYVVVNDAVLAMTSAEGEAVIPAARIKQGDTLTARFVGMQSVPLVWNGEGSAIVLELIPNVIENVVVTARGRDRSRQMFRRHVERVPTHGWYSGFEGNYVINYGGTRPWSSQGKYVRNHVPGEDANLRKINTFEMRPEAEKGAVLAWQIQRNVLLVCSLAERAVQFDAADVASRGMVVRYRGVQEGKHVFLIIKPYFDSLSGSDDSFQTILRVDPVSGIVTSSETVSQTRYGIWNVAAGYAVYQTGRGEGQVRFIYVTALDGKYIERNPDAEGAVEISVAISDVVPHHFTPDPAPVEKGY
jgi:hypothetical protein